MQVQPACWPTDWLKVLLHDDEWHDEERQSQPCEALGAALAPAVHFDLQQMVSVRIAEVRALTYQAPGRPTHP